MYQQTPTPVIMHAMMLLLIGELYMTRFDPFDSSRLHKKGLHQLLNLVAEGLRSTAIIVMCDPSFTRLSLEDPPSALNFALNQPTESKSRISTQSFFSLASSHIKTRTVCPSRIWCLYNSEGSVRLGKDVLVFLCTAFSISFHNLLAALC